MKLKKFLATGMASLVLMGSVCMPVAYADSVPIVTIGADLTEEQKDTIMSFFGVSENSVEVIEINNSQERQYLEGLIPNDVIGTRTLSCSYILPMTSGGIVVKTANLTWVSEGMLANALLVAGIENCQVLATAPFEVSGTGALTGVMNAYEHSSGQELNDTKKELATEELIITGNMIDEVVDAEEVPEGFQKITEAQLLELLNDIKSEVINGKLTEERVKEIVQESINEYKISLAEDTYNKLVKYLTSLSQEDYAKNFTQSLTKLTDRISNGFDINFNIDLDIDFKTDKNSIEQFWVNVWNWLKYLFGGMVDDAKESINIFENIDTDVIQYDEPVEEQPAEPQNSIVEESQSTEPQNSETEPQGNVEVEDQSSDVVDVDNLVAETVPVDNGEVEEW